MAFDPKNAKGGFEKAVDGVGRFARKTSAQVAEQAGELKDSAADAAEKLLAKKPDEYEEAVAEYNVAFTSMSDKGVELLRQRERTTDLIGFVAELVNSIAHTPNSFETDFDEINTRKQEFLAVEEFARRDLVAARQSAAGAGAGAVAGVAVASLAPTAALWVATTFGTASTGTAISALSGAAATNAALAWLGGGALAASGGGMAGGTAFLALAGPIGWGVAGATLLASIALFAKKKFDNREAKHEATLAIKENTASVRLMDAEITDLRDRSSSMREALSVSYVNALGLFGADFAALPSQQQSQLAVLVNNTKAIAALLAQRIRAGNDDE